MRLNGNSLVGHTKLRPRAKLGNGAGGTESASSSLLWLPGEVYCFPKELGFLSNLLLTPKVVE